MVRGHDVLARLELDAVGHEVHRLRGVSREHETLRITPEQIGGGALQVVPGDAGRKRGRDPTRVLGDRVHDDPGRRSECAVVQIDAVIGDQELATYEAPEFLVVSCPTGL